MASHIPPFDGRRALREALGAVTAAILLFAVPPSARAEALRQAPNTHVAMQIGKAFTASNRFKGFLDENSGASFAIAERPAQAYDEMKILADQPVALANNGITDTQKGTLRGRTGEYVYVTGWQRTPSADFAKFLLIMREKGVTAIITASVPQTALDQRLITREEIERTLASATVRTDVIKTVDLFRLNYLGPFKEADGFMGSSKAYSLDGRPLERGASGQAPDPLFVVSPSLDKAEVVDLKAAALQSFSTLGGFREHTLLGESGIAAGSLKGYAVTGEGVDIRSGTKNAIYFVMLAGQLGGYYMMVGTCPVPEVNVYLPEFQKMAVSFKPLQP